LSMTGTCRPVPSELLVRVVGCQREPGADRPFAPEMLRLHSGSRSAISSTWRSPITPPLGGNPYGTGGCSTKLAPERRCDSPLGGRRDGAHLLHPVLRHPGHRQPSRRPAWPGEGDLVPSDRDAASQRVGELFEDRCKARVSLPRHTTVTNAESGADRLRRCDASTADSARIGNPPRLWEFA